MNEFICDRCTEPIDDQTILTYQTGKDSRKLSRHFLHFDPCWLQVPDLAKQGIYELAWDVPQLLDRKDLT
jgi:hypothetical protein